MALVILPACSLPSPLSSLSCPSLRSCRSSRELCTFSSAARCKRSIKGRTDLHIQAVNERSPAASEKEKSSSSNSRRRFLALLLSSSVGQSLTQLIAGGNNVSAGAAVGSVADMKNGSSSDDLQDKKAIEGPIIGDLFGFDGLGKTPEEYVLGKVVALAQAGDGAVLFLGVDGFELPLQLVVGPAEAMAVLTAVQERKTRRPLTHEAWGLSLAAVGWKVDRVVITGNDNDVFYSSVVLSNLSQLLSSSTLVKKTVDMRPSDGIALALRCRAPLFVRRKVAEDLLSRKDELAGKTKVDPLKQPGLQANAGTLQVFVENPVSSGGERKPDFTVYSSWMRRLQSL
ncbi:unnamed protein product [Calypogeia fissa]